ncbi:filament-like plant protein 4 [Magnolia sinica]|uniref:filament-like plant protein 4 n=1 Tax=Magnolia sinica TaxID=86752 RepID=UPI002657F5B9|nr:filament-like plant protein 4 [Magnolia sinica]
MDRRSWPWKKKSSDKTVAATDSAAASLATSAGNQGDQENSKNVNYVQISTETYAHLTELEEKVKILNDQVKILNEKLSSAQSEMTTKDNLVKQHAKVAEEAVSGWEKAEAEALALKTQLESVTLLKLTAEDRAAHLDGALKECMRQIRNVKEENEQKLHDVVFAKTKQWEKVKFEFETKIADFEQELLRASAENAALSRSLQERSNMLMQISEEKAQADAEIEVLKTEIQSCEKEINSLKYELHIISKELEIRNEEKNMSLRSAEVANKQHLEGVKKIAKLEAECQRLRGLVRKKLPGPAALAQMKLEVENLGRDSGETRLRRSPVKSPSPHMAPAPEFSLDNVHQYHKEAEFLTTRLLTMEEENKMLKEALSKRNSELLAVRNLCAKTASKLRSMETQMQVLSHQKSPPKPNSHIHTEGSLSQNASNPPSLTSMSEDGIDEEASCADSWSTALISELSHFKKEKNVDKGNKADNASPLELMDDFLEMEKLACLSTESNGTISILDDVPDKRIENAVPNPSVDIAKDGDLQAEQQPRLHPAASLVSPNEDSCDKVQVMLTKLQMRISSIFESQAKDTDLGKTLEDIRCIVQDVQGDLPQHSVSYVLEETHSANAAWNQKPATEDMGETTIADSKPCSDDKHPIDEELAKSISKIHDFVASFGREAADIQDRCTDDCGLSRKIEEFCVSVNKVLCNEMSLDDFVLDLSRVLAEFGELSFRLPCGKDSEGETNASDCIDKVTLLENKVVQHDPSKERFSSECALVSPSAPDPEVPQEGSLGPGFELKPVLFKCSMEEYEHLKLEKDSMAMDLARCSESLENTKFKLMDTEKSLEELKSQLAASQKSNSLAETQLKCMAESYKSLEMHAQELETELNLLHARAETLDSELQEEKHNLQDALARCKDLEDRIQRTEGCSMCSLSSAVDVDTKTKQEREIASAAEKLAQCQETIFLLGRQLNAMRPPAEMMGSPQGSRHQMNEDLLENEPSPSRPNPRGMRGSRDFDQPEMESVALNMQRTGGESPLHGYNMPMSPSDTESTPIARSPIRSKHGPIRSSSSVPTPEKQGRSFSRFFSRGKSVDSAHRRQPSSDRSH